MRSPTAAGGLLPTGEASTATRTTSNKPLLRFYATEEMNPNEDSKKQNLWTSIQFVCQNPGKIGLSIQAVRKVTSAPAHFCDRGAHWFVVKLYMLGQLVTSYSVLSEEIR